VQSTISKFVKFVNSWLKFVNSWVKINHLSIQKYNNLINYTIINIDQLDTPALVIFTEGVKRNIQYAIDMIGDVNRLRPHIKTHKSPEAAQLMQAMGISKFKCATIAEAEMLGMCQAKDVVLAYQPIGPKLQRFINIIKKYPNTQYACLTDNIAAANAQSEAFLRENIQIPVYIDLNIGQNRTGIAPEDAYDLYVASLKMKGIRPVGFQAYDGHIRPIDFNSKKQECDDAFKRVEMLKNKISTEGGYPEPIIIAGGSPSFSVHSKRPDVICSPGTFVYWDRGYSLICPELPFSPAALLVTRIIALPDATKICVDLGHKSVASENDISKRVYFLNAPDLTPLSQSEEHLVLEAGKGHSFKVGDVLYGVPYHICPTVALYERAYTIENQQVTGEWHMPARDRRITI
jgi:D-serine deaminase-like pyridoxal phosphate-dependent protein